MITNVVMSDKTKDILQRYANYFRITEVTKGYIRKKIKLEPQVEITVSKGDLFGMFFYGIYKGKKHLLEVYRGRLYLTVFDNNKTTHKTYKQTDIKKAEMILLNILKEHVFDISQLKD